jgi:hypothetical protein
MATALVFERHAVLLAGLHAFWRDRPSLLADVDLAPATPAASAERAAAGMANSSARVRPQRCH